ncbi:MAG: 2-hydroxychromene-2-carboxylate isomerase [Rhizobacter sp.]
MKREPRPIDFHFDFSSPYSYVASEWIDALAELHGRTVNWKAILLGATFQAAELRSPVAHPIKREYSLVDFERSARFAGVPMTMPERFPIPTQNAARVFWWLHDQTDARSKAGAPIDARGWARHCFRALFVRGMDLSDVHRLRELAIEYGLDPAEAETVWNDPRWKVRLKEVNDAAIAAGVFGAPFFVIDGEPFWGNDRRAQIERWLASGPF